MSEIHENAPEVFWAERVYNGIRGAWVPRKLEHLHQVYNDNEHFCARDFAPFSTLLGEDWFLVPAEADPPVHGTLRSRSEEHTSELQSLMRISYAVFCLKKKNIVTT